jgi:protein CpxP
MKHASLLPLVLVLATTSVVFAQEPSTASQTSAPPSGQGPGGGNHGMMSPNEQLARMTKRYNLSANQQNEIKPILLGQQAQMQEMHGDSSLSPDERKAKMRSIRSDFNTKIESILNDDQKKQFEQDHQSTQ